MFGDVAHFRRLIRVGYVLARYRVLTPEPFDHRLSPGVRRGLGAVQALVPKAKAVNGENGDGPLRFGQRVAAAFQDLGPTYIKLGQLLATRPDIVGGAMADDLQYLQDKLPPFSVQDAWACLEEAFGERSDQLFAHMGVPVAAASVAQVHKATILSADHSATLGAKLADDGSDERAFAAVKVLRPDIEQHMLRDFDFLRWLAATLYRLEPRVRRLEPVSLIDTLRRTTETELDLRLEAAAASEFSERDRGRDLLRIPNVFWKHTSKRILTTEWIEGTPLSDLEALDEKGIDRTALAAQLLRAFLTHSLFDGYFHADFHQGNLLVDESGRLSAVDFGIMGRLSRETRRFLAEILYGFLTRDYYRLADVHFEAGYVPKDQPRDLFAQSLRSIGEPVFGKQARDISMARVLEQLFETTARFDMHLQPQLVLLQKTMVAAEGVARRLDPDINFWETARPIVRHWMEQNLGPEAVVEDLATSARKVAQHLRQLPDLLDQTQAVSEMMTPEGIKLHPDTLKQLAQQNTGKGSALPWVVAVLSLGIALLFFAGS